MGRKKKRKKHAAKGRGAAKAAPAVVAPVETPDSRPEAPPPEHGVATATATATAPTEVAPPVAERTPAPTATPASAGAPVTAAAPVTEPTPPSRPPQVDADLDADLDDDGDYDSLVALVAGMPDEEPPPPGRPTTPQKPKRNEIAAVDLDEDDDVAVVDLDEVGTVDDVQRLIAKTIAGAPPEPAVEKEEDEAPLIDLDADEPTPASKVVPSGPEATASAEAMRLAAAAARGAIEEPDVPTFFLEDGDVSTPEARARLLAATLAHAEHQEARYRVPMDTGATRRWKSAIATAVFLVAAWVALAPPAWVRPEPPAQLTAAARARAVRTALVLQAQQIEAFRVAAQRLPASLDELPARLPGVVYARAGGRSYQLIGYAPDGSAIVFDSADPAPPFQALLSTWPPAEDTP